MDEKVNFKIEKKSYPKDSIIILQGSTEKALYFLHQGVVEIKRKGDNTTGLTGREIIENSKRIGIIEAPSIFGVINITNNLPHDSSYVTATEALITKYIVPSLDFSKFFKANPPIALNVLLTLLDSSNKRASNIKKQLDFLALIDKFSDNFKFFYLIINGIKKDPLYENFNKNRGEIPQIVDINFLKKDNSLFFNKSYGEKDYDISIKFDLKQLKFFSSLLKAHSASFINLITHDNNIFLYAFEFLSSLLNSLNIETERLATQIEEKLRNFFIEKNSSFNLIYSIADKIKKHSNVDKSILGGIVTICRNIDLINKQLGGKEHVEIYPKYDVLLSQSEETGKQNQNLQQQVSTNNIFNTNKTQDTVRVTSQPEGKFQKIMTDSSKKILGYSTLHHEDKDRILKNLARINKINFDDPTSGESRKIIRNLQQDYFELYQNIFLKAITDSNIPNYILLFLYFSFINEKLISENQLEFLYTAMSMLSSGQTTEIPVITLFDYLKLIYTKEEEPSLSERGEFRKLVNKNFGKANKMVEDTSNGRLEFEIENAVANVLRITSDNMRAYIPYLIERSIRGNLANIFVTPKKLTAYIKKILEVDYTLFFRELTWKIPGKSELIQKEIYPYFILLPSAGIRVQMWQEMSYNIRSSRARFFLPVIFNGDLEKNLIFSCGHFRWNLNKAIVSNWMDPVEGGLTGAYYDYEQSYKKIPDLTEEAKEKIKKQIKSIKIDRNRFATDYYEWVVYESQGNPRLNKILRKIFYRYIPFTKKIRENIAKLPVYEELDRKFEIIRDREFKRLEAKYKKYKEGDTLPEDLQAYLDMMQK